MAKNIFSMNVNTLAVLVVFLSFVAFSHQQQQQQANHTAFMHKMRDANEACVTESGVDKELPRKAFKENVFTNDPKLKCYFKCVFQKMGRMDSNGNIDLTQAEDHIPPQADKAKITAALTKCKDDKGTDACDTAFKFAQCFRAAVGPMKHEH